MKKIDRKPYEVPSIQELGELQALTQGGNEVNSDSGSFPSDNNPNDAFGPHS